jgi:phage gp36-like protein
MSAMAYATVDDLLKRYDRHRLAELTTDNGRDPDETALAVALADASAEVNGYLARRHTTPLSPVPEVIVRLTCVVAVYNLATLQRDRDIEDISRRYEHAIAFLRRVADGTISLGLPGDGSPDGGGGAGGGGAGGDTGGAVFAEGREVPFGRDALKGY